jgi:hypothetical protein
VTRVAPAEQADHHHGEQERNHQGQDEVTEHGWLFP